MKNWFCLITPQKGENHFDAGKCLWMVIERPETNNGLKCLRQEHRASQTLNKNDLKKECYCFVLVLGKELLLNAMVLA